MPSFLSTSVRSLRRSGFICILLGGMALLSVSANEGVFAQTDALESRHENRESTAGVSPRILLSVFEDPENALSFSDVQTRVADFTPVNDAQFNAGITTSAFWLRLELQDADDTNEQSAGARQIARGRAFDGWLEIAWPYIDELDFYEESKSNAGSRDRLEQNVPGYQLAYATGRSRPYYSRPLDHRFFAFPLRLAAGESRVVYLRAKSDTFLIVPPRLVSRAAFAFDRETEGYTLGLYYGMLVVVFFYSLFIFASLRESAFLSYCIYVACLACYQLAINGIAFRFWPEATLWNKYSLPVFLAAVMLAAAEFIRRFLRLRESDPLLHRLWLLFSWVCAGLLGLVLVSYPLLKFLINAATVFLFLALITGVRSWRTGNHSARWFALAWLAPILGYLIQLAGTYDILPGWRGMIYAGQFGTAVEVVLLSLALADRINELKKEQHSWNRRLEDQVRERTGELNLALDEIHRESELTRIELDIAAGIQKGIMPSLELQTGRARSATYLQSLAPVGGDYFDVFEFKDSGHTAYLMADASGHGIPAALITTMAKICFMEATRMRGPHPREILLAVNDAIARLIKTHEYLTAALLIVGVDGEARYASAGHRRSFHFQRENSSVDAWDTEGILLGIYENDVIPAHITQHESRISIGDRFLMFTDGFTDVKNGGGERFGEERLIQLLIETAEQELLKARDTILDAWREFQRHGSRDDDCTLTLIEFQ